MFRVGNVHGTSCFAPEKTVHPVRNVHMFVFAVICMSKQKE